MTPGQRSGGDLTIKLQRAFLLLLLSTTLFSHTVAVGQVTTEQFDNLKREATRLLQEHRFAEAIETLKTAYNARPDPNVLGLMVMPYFASGLFPEAEDALQKAIAQGAEVSFLVRHNHSRGFCYGSLVVGPSSIRFNGAGPSDSFEVARTEIEKLRVFTSDNYRPGVDNPNANKSQLGGSPTVRLRAAKRNWNFEYALYGAGQYESSITGNLVYRGAELTKAERASASIAGVIQQAPMAAKNEEREINIKAGTTKDEVIAKLGQPLRSVVFGDKTIMKYSDITIELLKDKVVDVKTN